MSQSQPTPVTARCLRTGRVTTFPSMAAAAEEGFSQSGITRCIRGISKTHAGHEWTTSAKLRSAQKSKYREAIKAMLAEGKTTVQIADALGCSHSTVNYHRGGL